MAKTLGDMNYGIAPTPRGFAVRCLTSDKVGATRILKPDASALYGDLLTLSSKDRPEVYRIKGIDRRMDHARLHNAIDRCTNGWKVLPQ